MQQWPRVAVVGAGAVGSYFGAMLARAGAAVTLLGRPQGRNEHLEIVARDGLRIDGVELKETVSLVVGSHEAELADAELVLFCVKTMATQTAGKELVEHLRPEALVVSLQNGVDNVDRLRSVGIDAIPTVVYVAAEIEMPGTVCHRGRGDLVIGHATRVDDVRRVASWFEQADVPCRISEDIAKDQWSKLIINSMGNAISALGRASYRRLHEYEPTWRIALQVATEGVAVARELGIELSVEELTASATGVMTAVADATSSTEQDIARGRNTEIEALNGTISRWGSELGVATPINEALHGLVRLREGSDR